MSILSNLLGSDNAKLSQKAAGKATKTAEQNWADTAGLRKLGQTRIGAAPVSFADEFSGGPTYEAVNDPLLGQATGAASKSLASLSDGPDRMALVRQALSDLDKDNAVRQMAGEKRIGQRAASLGRIGNQGVTTEMGTLASDIERDRSAKSNALIADAIERTQGDKYSTLAAASGLADSAYGRGASERANKQGIAQQGVTNRAARIDAERAAGNDQFNQGVSLTDLGYGFSPEGAYGRQAANESGIAARKSATFNELLKTGAQAAAMAGGGGG